MFTKGSLTTFSSNVESVWVPALLVCAARGTCLGAVRMEVPLERRFGE